MEYDSSGREDGCSFILTTNLRKKQIIFYGQDGFAILAFWTSDPKPY